MYSKLASDTLGNWRFWVLWSCFCERSECVWLVLLSCHTFSFSMVGAWLELPCQIGQNQITPLAGHSKRFPCLRLHLPGFFKLNFCRGYIKVLKVVVSHENKYCALRSYTCKLSLLSPWPGGWGSAFFGLFNCSQYI